MSRHSHKEGPDAFPGQLRITGFGEVTFDALTVEARLHQRTISQQAGYILAEAIAQRRGQVTEMVAYLAGKHGVSLDVMWQRISNGEYEPLPPSEWVIAKSDPEG